MDHHTMQDQLFALYDGELADTARQEVEAHLASCAGCRHRYVEWQHTAKALFRVPQPEASEAFVYQLMERIDAGGQPRRATPWVIGVRWLVPALGLAGVLLVVLGPARRTVSIEALLLADGRENAQAQFVLAGEPPTSDEVFGYLMEGQP